MFDLGILRVFGDAQHYWVRAGYGTRVFRTGVIQLRHTGGSLGCKGTVAIRV